MVGKEGERSKDKIESHEQDGGISTNHVHNYINYKGT